MARLTRTDAKLMEILNSKAAPDFSTLDYTAPDFDARYGLALNWVHQAVENDELVREAQRYFTRVGREDAAGVVKQIPFGIQQTMGKIAYCLNRGAQLSPKSHTYLDNGLRQAKQAPQEADGIETLKARVLLGKVALRDVPGEVEKILDAHNGARVRQRLVSHYKDALDEAQADRLIRDWVKPLRAILKALGTEAAAPKQERKAAAKLAPSNEVKKAGRKMEKSKPAVKARAEKPSTPRETGKPSFVAQVRQLISEHKPQGRTVREVTAMAEALGMKPSSARNAVVGCWDRV
jgi:hypothetical protein